MERDLTLQDLERADEVFVTNALFGIWPVARLDERDIGLGTQTAALAKLLGSVTMRKRLIATAARCRAIGHGGVLDDVVRVALAERADGRAYRGSVARSSARCATQRDQRRNSRARLLCA